MHIMIRAHSKVVARVILKSVDKYISVSVTAYTPYL